MDAQNPQDSGPTRAENSLATVAVRDTGACFAGKNPDVDSPAGLRGARTQAPVPLTMISFWIGPVILGL